MPEQHEPEDILGAQLRNLGQNLKQTLKTAWQSEERKRIHREISGGLNELEGLLKEASDELRAGEIGHEIREGVSDIREKVESGELENRIREDLVSVLQTINEELQMLSERWAAGARPTGRHGDSEGGEQDA